MAQSCIETSRRTHNHFSCISNLENLDIILACIDNSTETIYSYHDVQT